jgi:hypothetical protein
MAFARLKECRLVTMTHGVAMNQPSHGSPSELMNYLVRMVVPMRREFGRPLDVQHFLHDPEYAHAVIQLALTSQDARLLQYAKYVADHHFGLGNASNTPPSPPLDEATPAVPQEAVEVPLSASPTAAELRERLLRKYTRGPR